MKGAPPAWPPQHARWRATGRRARHAAPPGLLAPYGNCAGEPAQLPCLVPAAVLAPHRSTVRERHERRASTSRPPRISADLAWGPYPAIVTQRYPCSRARATCRVRAALRVERRDRVQAQIVHFWCLIFGASELLAVAAGVPAMSWSGAEAGVCGTATAGTGRCPADAPRRMPSALAACRTMSQRAFHAPVCVRSHGRRAAIGQRMSADRLVPGPATEPG